ncbi:metallophosphoesterase domain-containing protein 1 isoform X2 [Phymastichus coffea]|uniref:metallophosphoesterase domain-containing protein 1 isoform X2 n=1 Tax=Phymastichus coffea TaxID=108790 RepID=UPI00273C6CD9|nr:metallophosphoesterase domain-containing protein 1 isoform X2 [Phymastichus coffea]
MKIEVHPLTQDPTTAWQELAKQQKFIKINAKIPTTPASKDKLRIVCMSDTHSLTQYIKFNIPDGDVFIHAGDFTKRGRLQEFFADNLPHKHKIVIAGNHELSFDPIFTHAVNCQTSETISSSNVKDVLTNCTYLEDSEIVICGIKIYGSPWQPKFYNWAFNLLRGEELLSKWNKIPDDTDILVTHSPPVGHGDLCYRGVRAGCVELLTTVQNRVKPKYHIFGHIHEGYGISSDGEIIFINASTCDLNYQPSNLPIVFDITLPPGIEKD